MKTLTWILVVLVLAGGTTWYFAGRSPGPSIRIAAPSTAIGPVGELDVIIDTPQGKLDRIEVVLEQGATRIPVFTFPGDRASPLSRTDENRLRLIRPIGKRVLPQLQAGNARISVTAVRPVLFGYRHVQATVTREFDVRLTPPSLGALSSFHYVNLGGSEMVVYRVSPANAASGVRVGEYEYPGFPASGAGIANAEPGLYVAFFALLWDQDPDTPITLFARDDIGNEARANFDYRVLPKTFRKSRIELEDRFLAKVVPPILQNSPELKVESPSDLLAAFLRINGDLRKQNAGQIAALARQTEPKVLWHGAFKQLVNTAVQGSFADQRTYVYKRKEVDHQAHLGFDLASTAMAPVVAANSGKVLHAGWLGIYGNCVILDHGMGLQSLYAHLSSINVKPGDRVNEGATLGRSGSTGLAGGDHLHFTMLLGGHPVTPIDWWSSKWIEDRIVRKLREAESSVPPQFSGSGRPSQ
jgi:murein DD-endopeptidase MepM/ murein hydrolase activator NlpD